MRRRLPLCLVAFVLLATPLWAGPQVARLANGCTLVVEEDHSAPVASVYFFIGTGSSFEGRWLGSGISHLVEHCLDRGSLTRTTEQIQATQAALGSNTNAYTSQDTTGYFVQTSGAQTIAAIDHLADYVLHPTFPAEQVTMEQGIISREMARDEDDPSRVLYWLFSSTIYRQSPQRLPVIGTRALFDKLTRADLVAYYQQAYVPENMVVSVVGDFDGAQVLAHLREVMSQAPAAAYARPALPAEPPQLGARRQVREDAKLSRTYLTVGYPTVSLYSADMYPLDVAAYILANGDASRLAAKLRDEQGLVDGVSASSATPEYVPGFFAVTALTSPAKAAAAERALIAGMLALRDKPVTAAELARARKQKESELVFGRLSTEGRATNYAGDLMSTGNIDFSQRYVEGIRRVTAADIQRVARQYFRSDRLNVAVLRPPVKQAAATGPARVAGEQKIVRLRLANGLRVLVQENHAAPVVNLFLALNGGQRYETPQHLGQMQLLAQMLVRGTQTRSRLQIAEALENVGGSLAPFSGRNSFGLSAQVLRADLPLAVEIAADVLQRPTFPAGELQQEKQQALASLAMLDDDVDDFARNQMLQTLFPAYPYRYPLAGTKQAVAACTRADLVRLHSTFCRPGNAVLAVFGDVTPAQVRTLLEKQFAGWQAGGALPAPLTPDPPPAQPLQREVTRAQQQAIIYYGFPGPKIGDADRYQRTIMSGVLAGLGYPGGRLHEALRSAQLVYATFGGAMAGPQTGYFSIYAGTAPDKIQVVCDKIEAIIRDLQARPCSAEELQRAKQAAVAEQALSLETSAARAQGAALNELQGLGAEEMFRYAAAVQEVTAEQVQAQARKWLDLNHRVLVITRPENK